MLDRSEVISRLKHAIDLKDFKRAAVLMNNFDLPENSFKTKAHDRIIMEVDIYLNGVVEQIDKMYLYEKLQIASIEMVKTLTIRKP